MSECQTFESRVADLNAKIARLEDEEDMPRVRAELLRLRSSLRHAEDQLADCIAAHPPLLPPLQSHCTATGTFTLAHPRTPQPLVATFSFDLVFSPDRKRITVGPLPEFTKTIMTPVGENTTRMNFKVTEVWHWPVASKYAPWGGEFDSILPVGTMWVPGSWSMDHSIDLGDIAVVDSTVYFVLSTAAPGGSPIDAAGNFTVAGTYVRPWGIGNGILAGCTWELKVSGTITPHP